MVRKTRYGFPAAISIVVANMIGTGVFTSLGFQLLGIKSAFAILLLWALGGVAAFSGAVAYAELGAALKRSGGEYQFLARIFHPAAGLSDGENPPLSNARVNARNDGYLMYRPMNRQTLTNL